MSDNTKKKVLFLDVDGVLTSARAHLAFSNLKGLWFDFDPIAVAAIARACEVGNVEIVVSSTWRKDHIKTDLFQQLEKYGLMKFVRQPNWRTPEIMGDNACRNACRGDEVAQYLKDNPEIESYRILDDVPQFLDTQKDKTIITDEENGMDTTSIRKLYYWAGVMKG